MTCAPMFSPIESGVAACLLDGLTGKESARALSVSERTVKRVLGRLRYRFRAESKLWLTAEIAAVEREWAAIKPLGRALTTGEPL